MMPVRSIFSSFSVKSTVKVPLSQSLMLALYTE